jgi:hypothetical protein
MTPISNTTKRGRGRPRINPDLKKQHVTLRLPKQSVESLHFLSNDLAKSQAEVITLLLAMADPFSELNGNVDGTVAEMVEGRLKLLHMAAKLDDLGARITSDKDACLAFNIPWTGTVMEIESASKRPIESRFILPYEWWKKDAPKTQLEFTALPECVIREEFRA